jgi:hypothetical protein
MRLKSEDQLLDIAVRKRIIDEIKGPENQMRKDEAWRRYQCYKDQTKQYVMENLILQFDQDTVQEMRWAISNVAFTRKITDKLARVYKYGVEREAIDDEATTEAIHVCTKESDVNNCFKKTNRYLKLMKNCIQYIIPKKLSDDSEKMTLKAITVPPYLYDAVELEDNREVAACYILSDYDNRKRILGLWNSTGYGLASGDGRGTGQVVPMRAYSDGVDQTIADDPRDQKRFKGFVFWSNKYHFTCNEKGEIISESNENPIDIMPIVNYAEDQDGAFWSIGGDDLADGAVQLNCMMTNINHIAITQGYGQLVMTGKSPPRNLKTGPNKAVILEQQEGDPTPTFEFKNSNPPLDQLRALIEMYVALLLTTNNLSTSGISSNLNGGAAFASGIALMIDKAESMEDVEDQRQIFLDKEPMFWNIYAKWHTLLKSSGKLVDELAAVSFAPNFDLSIKFGKPTAIITETEQLDIMERKIALKLISHLDALRMEYPDMTDEQLKDKLEEIISEGLDANRSERNNSDQLDNSGEDRSTRDDKQGDEGDDRGVPDRTDPPRRSEEA